MLPYKTLISIERPGKQAVFLQIAKGLIHQIKKGRLPAGTKIPGTRKMAVLLGVNRQTVVAAYEELYAQGWLESVPPTGTFVAQTLPEIHPQKLSSSPSFIQPLQKTGFPLVPNTSIQPPGSTPVNSGLCLDDGMPDIRLAPLDLLGRNYRSILQKQSYHKYLNYSSPYGDVTLRKVLAQYLADTRGLHITEENILITRGSIMAIYLAFQVVLQPRDTAVVARLNYRTANMMILHAGAKLYQIPLDAQGICLEALEKVCRQQPVRVVYVISHHHHPTTVTLSAERRIRLMQLAEEYRFALIEDDYDYDFHYKSSPLLPLASMDTQGLVIYTGSFSKNIAPAFRVGFLVAPQSFIEEASKLRRIIDRQGDVALEKSVAILLQEGDIRRHLKKSLRTYQERRDYFCSLLHEVLRDAIRFEIPQGGMAVWVSFDAKFPIATLKEKAAAQGLFLSGNHFEKPNALRMGFASSTLNELEQSVQILKNIIY